MDDLNGDCINSQIGKTMNRMRKINNHPMSYIADSLNISTGYLSEIENGKKNIDIKLINEFSNVFEITISDFFKLNEFLAYDYGGDVIKYILHEIKRNY